MIISKVELSPMVGFLDFGGCEAPGGSVTDFGIGMGILSGSGVEGACWGCVDAWGIKKEG